MHDKLTSSFTESFLKEGSYLQFTDDSICQLIYSFNSESLGYDVILHQTHQIVKVSDIGSFGRRFIGLLIYGPSRQHLKVGIFYSPLRERLRPMSSSSIGREKTHGRLCTRSMN